jgi:hypothetical protein
MNNRTLIKRIIAQLAGEMKIGFRAARKIF